ncbi:uncharacterized protein LOC132699871 isoform X1 [Cylas formicarius]|uniref:uncharacterized protein LOC132699871 isoform X1 n=1 Tax=Cylas formicarius TaxID=197179 RepID=UPI002958B179|nr:uncharacterized protein LOC132699871 isoform X1 [Cylas formicarius]
MDQQAQLTVCRLCLKDVEANTSCLPITNNSLVLQNLNLISFATIRNLQLTEEPVLCELCEEKLKKLAYFKENVITNEFKIQCHQKRDINFFLQTLSSDIDQICRLCLKTSAYNFDKTWKDNKKLFVKCNIHLNLNISKPSKMCEECYKMLQETYYFVCDSIEKEKFIVSTYSLKKETLIGKDLLNIFNSLQKFDNNKAAGSESPDTSDVVENNNNVNDDENLDSTLIDNKPEAIPISHNNITTKAATELERSCNQPLAEQETYEMPKQASAAIDLIVVHEKNITVINKCDDSSEKAPGLALSEQSGEQLIQRVESPVEQQEIGSATKCDEEKESGMEPQDSNKEIKSLALTDTKPKNDSNIIKKGLHKTTEVKGDSNSVKTEASERNHEEKKLNELAPADTENNNKQNDDTSAAAVDNDIEKKMDHSVDKTVLKASNDPTPNVAEVSTAISCNGDPKQTESGKGKEFQANRDWSFLDAASQDLTSIFGEVSECSDSVNDMYKITETVDVVEINVSTTNGKSGFSGRNKSISPSRQELIDLLEDNVSMDIPVNDSQVATLEQGTKVGGDEDKDNSNVDIEDNKINENKAGLKKKGMPKKGIKLEVYPEKEEIRKAVEQRGENNKPINIRVSPRNKNIKAEKQHKLKRGKNKEISPEIRKSPRTKVTEGVLNQNKQLDAKSKMSPKDDVFPDSEPLNFVPGRGRPKKTINAELKFDDSFDSGVVSVY